MPKKNPVKLRSMTSFGRAISSKALGHLEVRVQANNRRYLEMNLALPSSFASFEPKVRKLIESQVSRGQISLIAKWQPKSEKALVMTLNEAKVKALKKIYEKLSKEFKVNHTLCLDAIVREEGLVILEDTTTEEMQSFFLKIVQQALDEFILMREQEGELLAKDLCLRIKKTLDAMKTIEKEASKLPELMRKKLQKRVEGIFSEKESEDESRLLKEIALIADKADVTEEIIRFNALALEFKKTVERAIKENEGKGKRLDFLLQELFREINTLSAKAQMSEVTQKALDIKCELEKIREQVQNIE